MMVKRFPKVKERGKTRRKLAIKLCQRGKHAASRLRGRRLNNRVERGKGKKTRAYRSSLFAFLVFFLFVISCFSALFHAMRNALLSTLAVQRACFPR